MADIYSWTPEQLSQAKTFFAQAPAPEDIYQKAAEYQLNPEQLSSLWAQATGGDYGTGLSAVNQYLGQTGQSLGGGIQSLPTTQPVDYSQTADQNVISPIGVQPTTNQFAGQTQQIQTAPEEYLKGTSGYGYKDIVDYITANINDPVRVYQAALEAGVDPQEIIQAQKGVGSQNLLTEKEIQDYFAKGQAGFAPRFESLVGSLLGPAEDRSQLEQIIRTQTNNPNFSISSVYDPSKFSGMALENIGKKIQESPLNKIQDAIKLSSVAKNYLGYNDEEASNLINKAYSGKLSKDSPEEKIYNTLLQKNDITGQDYKELMSYAAVNNPDAPIFQKNPDALKIYRPIGDLKTSDTQVGQYGYVNNAPILSASEADRLLGKDVFTGGPPNPITGEWNKDDSKLGWNLNSKYASSISNGAGVFGLTSSSKDIDDFDNIEKEIAKGGGIKTVNYGEGPIQFVNVSVYDPESSSNVLTQKPLDSLFPPFDENGFGTGTGYKNYQNARNALEKGASQLGIDSSQYSSIKDLYNAVNEKSKDIYAVTGRANNWDPKIAAEQGITGVGQSRGGVNHATVLYKKVGDKLVPVETLKTFNFDDPNTSRGFFGDIATGIGSILSVPPIALALSMAGGLPALLSGNLGVGMAAGAGSSALAEAMAESIFNPVNLGEKILSGLGAGTSTIAQYAPLVGQTALSAGMGGLSTGLMTGDLEKAGIGALAGGLGAGVFGGTSMLLKDFDISPAARKLASEIAGGSAATAVTGQDPGAYALNRILSTGIGALTSIGAEKTGIPTKGPEADLFKAMLPVITSKKVNPDDVVRIAQAVKAYEAQKDQG